VTFLLKNTHLHDGLLILFRVVYSEDYKGQSTPPGARNPLPRVAFDIFQDAVHIVRGLGVRYLWIDSLCIVQDGEQNISASVSSMTSIYINALLVIGAYRFSWPGKNRSSVGLWPTLNSLPGEAVAHVENYDGSMSQVQARLLRNRHGHFCGVSRPMEYGVWSWA
jgi:hypothetical protein